MLRGPRQYGNRYRDASGHSSGSPLEGLVEPVGGLGLFLASDRSSSISGTEHVIDGGPTAS